MTYRFAACTMPQCQTSAGCICERALRPTRPADPLSGATPVEFAIAKLKLQPGDILVMRTALVTNVDIACRITNLVKGLLPDGAKFMLVDQSTDLTVIRPEGAPPEGGR